MFGWLISAALRLVQNIPPFFLSILSRRYSKGKEEEEQAAGGGVHDGEGFYEYTLTGVASSGGAVLHVESS